LSSVQNLPIAAEGKVIPLGGQLTALLTLDQSASYGVLQLNALNDGGTTTKISVAISSAAAPNGVARVDYIESGDELKPNGRYTNFGLLILPGQTVYVRSDSGNVVFRGTLLAQVA
jgi:hypothetical protein